MALEDELKKAKNQSEKYAILARYGHLPSEDPLLTEVRDSALKATREQQKKFEDRALYKDASEADMAKSRRAAAAAGIDPAAFEALTPLQKHQAVNKIVQSGQSTITDGSGVALKSRAELANIAATQAKGVQDRVAAAAASPAFKARVAALTPSVGVPDTQTRADQLASMPGVDHVSINGFEGRRPGVVGPVATAPAFVSPVPSSIPAKPAQRTSIWQPPVVGAVTQSMTRPDPYAVGNTNAGEEAVASSMGRMGQGLPPVPRGYNPDRPALDWDNLAAVQREKESLAAKKEAASPAGIAAQQQTEKFVSDATFWPRKGFELSGQVGQGFLNALGTAKDVVTDPVKARRWSENTFGKLPNAAPVYTPRT